MWYGLYLILSMYGDNGEPAVTMERLQYYEDMSLCKASALVLQHYANEKDTQPQKIDRKGRWSKLYTVKYACIPILPPNDVINVPRSEIEEETNND